MYRTIRLKPDTTELNAITLSHYQQLECRAVDLLYPNDTVETWFAAETGFAVENDVLQQKSW